MKIWIIIKLNLLLLFISPHCFSQVFTNFPEKTIGQTALIATYLHSYQRDSLNSARRRDRMTLLIGENVSSFFSESFEAFRMVSKKSSNITELLDFMNSGAIPAASGAVYRVFKNYPEGEITTTDHIPSDSYLYTESIPLFDWVISPETSMILGYTVHKATTGFGGREWIAWFAPEIPFNDGPYKFHGLPGLIIKVHDTRNHHMFELISIESPAEATPILFTERHYIKTSKERFFRAWHAYRSDFNARTGQSGMDPYTRTVLARSFRRNNNPIELID